MPVRCPTFRLATGIWLFTFRKSPAGSIKQFNDIILFQSSFYRDILYSLFYIYILYQIDLNFDKAIQKRKGDPMNVIYLSRYQLPRAVEPARRLFGEKGILIFPPN